MASANVSTLAGAGVKYIISTGGAAGSFTCGTDAGFATFIEPMGVVGPHRRRLRHRGRAVAERHPGSRLAHPDGARRVPGPALQPDDRDAGEQRRRQHGAVAGLGRAGQLQHLRRRRDRGREEHVRIELAELPHDQPDGHGLRLAERRGVRRERRDVPDGAVGPAGRVQPARPLRRALRQHRADADDRQNDASSEQFTLGDADTVASFAIANGLAGVHYWSYDRDVDCGRARPRRRATRWAAVTPERTAT